MEVIRQSSVGIQNMFPSAGVRFRVREMDRGFCRVRIVYSSGLGRARKYYSDIHGTHPDILTALVHALTEQKTFYIRSVGRR